jgi:tetrahydromethanopterin S-methyltransferase subunit G
MLFCFFSCKTPSNDIDRSEEKLLLRALTDVYNYPIEGVTIYISPSDSCVTDSNGNCSIIIKSRAKGKLIDIYATKESIGLKASFNLMLSNPIILIFDLNKEKLKVIEPKIDSRIVELREFDDDLNSINQMLGGLEERIHLAITEYGENALSEYIPMIGDAKERYSRLISDIKTLKERYSGTLASFSMDEIVNIQASEDSFNDLSNRIREYTNKANNLASEIDINIDANPIEELEYRFKSGDFEQIISSKIAKDQLTNFSLKVKDYINRNFSFAEQDEILVMIYFVGYTDGQSIGENSSKYIKQTCESTGISLTDDLNDCLSYLRAYHISNLFESVSTIDSYQIELKGEGSILSNGKTEKNPEIRKCTVSFVVYEK